MTILEHIRCPFEGLRRVCVGVSRRLRGGPWRVAMRVAGIVAGGAVALAALVYAEHRVGLGARMIGRVLAATNGLRQPAGEVWEQVQGHTAVKDSLAEIHPASLPASQGIPSAVARARFEIDEVPGEHLPGFLAVWRTPLSEADAQMRRPPELVESIRAYRVAVSLLEVASIPASNYAVRAQEQLDALYRSAGGRNVIESVEGDSLSGTPVNSIRVSVAPILVQEYTRGMQEEDRARLLEELREGLIAQIIVMPALGIYSGEVEYHDATVPSVSLEITPQDLALALGLEALSPGPVSESTDPIPAFSDD